MLLSIFISVVITFLFLIILSLINGYGQLMIEVRSLNAKITHVREHYSKIININTRILDSLKENDSELYKRIVNLERERK